MSADVRIRAALEDDMPSLVQIYNHYVENTAATFDTEPFDVKGRRAWFESFSASGVHRLLVAEQSGNVVGYASSSKIKNRPAYDTSVETTVYLDPTATGGGIGTRLFAELFEILIAAPKLHRAYGGIALPNEASVALHEKFAFEHVGTYREVGFKFDRFWDVAWFEKDLSR